MISVGGEGASGVGDYMGVSGGWTSSTTGCYSTGGVDESIVSGLGAGGSPSVWG